MSVLLGDSDGSSAAASAGSLGQLKQDIQSLSKQLNLIRQDIAATNKQAAAQTEESLS